MSLHTTIPAVQIINGNVPAMLNFDVNFNDAGLASGVKKYTLWADAAHPMLLEFFAEVITAFNAGTTNTLTLGSNATANQFIGTLQIDESTPGFYPTSNANFKIRIVAPTDIYVKYVQAGTVATTGQAKFYIRTTPLFEGT